MSKSKQMARSRSTSQACDAPIPQIQRVFRDAFCASDIAEPLVSWDGESPAADVRRRMEAMRFEAAGVRIGGSVVGWVLREELVEGRCVDSLRSFFESPVISSRVSLRDVIEGLGRSPRLFVTAFGAVGGIITRADLQKAPVRMWLFGLVTLVEERFTKILKEHFPGDSWHGELSPSRLAIAQRLHGERIRRNEQLDLADCLQFADKGHILFKNETIRKTIGFESRVRAKEVVRGLEKLRNNLAHSQDIVEGNLETIVNLAQAMDRVLEVTS